jgi:hypothetical protein
MTATHSKAVNTEQRVNNLVGSVSTTNKNVATITSQQATITGQQGSFGGFSGANQSGSMPGGMVVTYDPSNSGNEGGSNSSTSGQIGGAAAHTHSMTHKHTDSADLQNKFNALQSSFADICGRLNSMYTALQRAGIL